MTLADERFCQSLATCSLGHRILLSLISTRSGSADKYGVRTSAAFLHSSEELSLKKRSTILHCRLLSLVEFAFLYFAPSFIFQVFIVLPFCLLFSFFFSFTKSARDSSLKKEVKEEKKEVDRKGKRRETEFE